MTAAVRFTCQAHPDPFACPDALLHYADSFDEYGLIVHDGGASSVLIRFCPWCGLELPASKRDRWFEELARLGFSDPTSQAIPDDFRSSAWWRTRSVAESMLSWQVIVDVDAADEADALARWLDRWKDRVVVSENQGCGCCVDIWQVSGPMEANAELPEKLLGFDRSSAHIPEDTPRE